MRTATQGNARPFLVAKQLMVAVRKDLPSALNPVSGHYFDRARSLPADPVQPGKMVEHRGIAPRIPVWKTGVYLSTPMLEKWSPV